MKVFAPPKEVPYADPDYSKDFDFAQEQKREAEHQKRLADWLRANGYPGARTGEILTEPHADGYARYMLAQGKRSVLIHLPYGDAWDNPNVHFLPMKEVLRRIDAPKRLAKFFALPPIS